MANFPLSNQNQDMPPPWMEGSKDISGQEMIVVHMSNGELEGLDNMQKGPSIDPDTGIREYSALANIIEIPEVREVFKHVSNELTENGQLSPDLDKIYESAYEHSLPYKPTPEERHNPLKKAEHTGRDGDTKLALIPLNLALFLIELRHEPSINPKTGLLEFSFWKKMKKKTKHFVKSIFKNPIRTAGTIVGAMLGGPMGAGVGNTLGSLASGKSLQSAIKSGSLIGGAGYVGQGIGQAAGVLGGSPNLVAQGLEKLGIGSSPPLEPSIPLESSSSVGVAPVAPWIKSDTPIGQNAEEVFLNPGEIGNEVVPSLNKISSQIPVPQDTSGGFMDKLGGYMDTAGKFMAKAAPLAPLGVAALAYAGSKQHNKHMKHSAKEEREYLENEKEKMGFNRPLPPIKRSSRRYNPKFYDRTELERRYGIFPEPAFIEEEEEGRYAKGGLVKSYNKGTLVSGPGKGQDDKIKTSVPDGSYIIDASSTSMFGDGSTKAGSDILKDFENRIKSKFPKKFIQQINRQVSRKSSQVPVWLSEGEHKIDPVTVTLLGDGSNVNGADILKHMVIKLRKHKISKGDGLPPKAKHPLQYISI